MGVDVYIPCMGILVRMRQASQADEKEETMKKKKGTSHHTQLHRLNRIEGQIRGLSKMVEDQRYCVDILTQIKAVKSALSSVEQNIIQEHLSRCVHQAITSKNKKESQKMLQEIKVLLKSIQR